MRDTEHASHSTIYRHAHTYERALLQGKQRIDAACDVAQRHQDDHHAEGDETQGT